MRTFYIRSLPFILGLGAQVGQVVLLRELFIVFSGNEFSFGIAFGAWLLACGLGSALGALLMGYVQRIRLLWTLTSLLTLGALVGAIGALRLSHQFFKAPRGQPLSLFELSLTALVSLGVCAFLFGLQYVIALRFLSQKEEGDASTAYLYEAWGALVGGVLFTFLLIYWSSFSILVFLVFAFFLGALGLFRQEEKPFYSRPVLVGLSLFFLLALSLGFFSKRADFWLEKQKWDSYFEKDLKLESTRATPFGHISHFTRAGSHYLYYNGFQYLIFPNQEAGAGRAHFLLNQHLSPRDILIIGGGPQGFSEILLYPLKSVDYLELDPDLLDLSLQLASSADQKAFRDSRVSVFHQDGRAFIKESPDYRYDLMALFVPSPSTAALNRYYTLEFFEETRRVLRSGGVLVLSLESAFSLDESSPKARQNRLIYHTLAKVFKNIKITPGDTNILLCTNHPENTSLDPKELARRYLEGKINSPFYSSRYAHYSEETKRQPEFLLQIMASLFEGFIAPRHIKETLLAYRGEKKKGQESKKLVLPWLKKKEEQKELARLYTSPEVKESTLLNRDDKPLAPLYYLLAWNREVEKRELPLVPLLELISWKNSLWALGGLFLCLLLVLMVLRGLKWNRAGKTTGLLSGIFAAGFWGMAIEMILLVSFQSRQGYIYSAMGLLIGLFMLGLGLGTSLLKRLLKKHSPDFCFKVLLLIQGFMALLLPHLLQRGEGVVFYGLLNWGAGFLVGAIFPVGNALMREMGWTEERAGGWIYSFDVWGATLAAFFTTTFLITRLGTLGAAYMIALFPLLSLVLKGVEEKIFGRILEE